MGGRINTIMQTCFFAISGVLPRDEAIAQIKKAIEKTYGKKGAEVVKRNFAAVDAALENLHEVEVPAGKPSGTQRGPPHRPRGGPGLRPEGHRGDDRRQGRRAAGVSAFPVDGTWPTGTTQWEKRDIALEIPVWDDTICIQCNKCAMVCPHAAIRAKVYDPEALDGAPETFKSTDYKGQGVHGHEVHHPGRARGLHRLQAVRRGLPGQGQGQPEAQGDRHGAAGAAPGAGSARTTSSSSSCPSPTAPRSRCDVKGSQFLTPLFEYSGACAGCGETPYVKLLTQLFGDRMLIANATGCSSIYGGNLPTTPYTTNADGRGPAWSNSLFEDNAEFGFGFRLAVDQLKAQAAGLVTSLNGKLGDELVEGAPRGRPVRRGRHRRPARARRRRCSETLEGIEGRARRARLAPDRRLPRQEERLDRRRRRLGLRHRLRRPRPRPGMRPRREHPGPRHRGLLQHRRPGVQGHAARGRRPSSPSARQGDRARRTSA